MKNAISSMGGKRLTTVCKKYLVQCSTFICVLLLIYLMPNYVNAESQEPRQSEFSADSCQKFEVLGLAFSVPDYFKLDNINERDTLQFFTVDEPNEQVKLRIVGQTLLLQNGLDAVAPFVFDGSAINGYEFHDERTIEPINVAGIDGLLIIDTQYPKESSKAAIHELAVLLYEPDQNTFFGISIYEPDNTIFSYADDFYKMLDLTTTSGSNPRIERHAEETTLFEIGGLCFEVPNYYIEVPQDVDAKSFYIVENDFYAAMCVVSKLSVTPETFTQNISEYSSMLCKAVAESPGFLFVNEDLEVQKIKINGIECSSVEMKLYDPQIEYSLYFGKTVFYPNPNGKNVLMATIIEDSTSEYSYSEDFLRMLESASMKQITFRNIPWGTNYTDAVAAIPGVSFWALSGESYKTYSVDQVITESGKSFEFKDINIICNQFSGSVNVAGYETSDISMYFAYTPVNGKLPKTESASALYAAKYEFEPNNAKAMGTDLLEKLTELYGEPSKTTFSTNLWKDKTTYTYWYGGNNTMVVLCIEDESKSTYPTGETISIVYAWEYGDTLLQQASDILKAEANTAESANYGNGNMNGL